MRKIHLIGPTTALLGLFAIAADTAPALAGGAPAVAGNSPSRGVYLPLPSWLSSGPQVTPIPIFGGHDTFTQTPCGGDFGMLGNIETEQEAVAQANPMNAPVCE